ncbi:copper resistance protein B [Thermomonas sp.]|uniref:copper resistance protein B n=1 Tax=Thermomonas sp. TaxID=1971895 RepID=UPI002637623E|nr:copper resistance protein B [Thermomonas sp.]
MRTSFALALLLFAGLAGAQDHAGHAMHGMPPMHDEARVTLHDAQEAPSSSDDGADTGYRPPALTDADRAAAFPPLQAHDDHADPLVWTLQMDRLEHVQGDGLAWDGRFWIGHDRGRLWLRSEGQRAQGRTTSKLEALWGTPVDAWWDVLVGLRHDAWQGGSRDWLAVGVQGLAPYKFELQATAYLGNRGQAMLQTGVEYELLFTNRLILQPRIEATLNARDDPGRGMGAGLSEASAGLRLRYEVRRELAPYVGYEWSRRFGRTASFARLGGEPVHNRGWVAGLRFWF